MMSNVLYYLTLSGVNKRKDLIPNPINDSMGKAKLYWLWPNMGFRQGRNGETKEITIQALVNLVIFSLTYI